MADFRCVKELYDNAKWPFNPFSRSTVITLPFPQMFIARAPVVRFGQSKVCSTWVYVLRTHIPSFGGSL